MKRTAYIRTEEHSSVAESLIEKEKLQTLVRKMANLFDSESFVWKPFGYIADVFILSGMWFICSLPLVSMGAATTALYDCCARCVRGEDKAMFSRFFRTFRREFIPSLLASLVWAAVVAGAFSMVKVYGNGVRVNNMSVMITTALLLLVTVLLGVAVWVLPLLSRFTFRFSALNITAIRLAVAHFPRTMALGIITVISGYLCIRLWVPFLFLPAVTVLLWTLLLEPVFRIYMEPEKKETEQ